MEEIANAQKLAQDILNKKKMSSYPRDNSEDEVLDPTFDSKDINSDKVDIPVPSSDEEDAPIVPRLKKQRKKRSTEQCVHVL